ncbi:microfibril-associated glycoprotein 4-like isoform X2 [Oculina patagonica]
MATHMKIGLLTCLLLLMILMEEVKPVLAGHIERLKQRTKILEENMKKMEERMKALEECKACSKIKELNETVSELQEKKPKPDVDECSASISVCDVNADCQNTVGSYICSCKAGFTGDGKTCTAVQKDCAELFKTGKQKSGVYAINPDGSNAFDVFCDQTIAGGGWTVFQKRLDGSVDFYRGWDDYKRGFGNLTGEFWLGLEKIHRLTSSGQFKLRVDLEDYAGKTGYAEYDSLAIASEGDKYKLSLGSYSGTSGDSLTYHNGHPFTTKDQNNDPEYYNCAVHYSGAWWYNRCYGTNMNGIYHQGQYKGTDGIIWWAFSGYSVKRAEMKIRPVNF